MTQEEHVAYTLGFGKALYGKVKNLALAGKNVFVDTVEFDQNYEIYSEILGHNKVVKILVYCPLDVIIEHVEKRNLSSDQQEHRLLNQAFTQFAQIYKLQDSDNEMVVDRISSARIKMALDKAKEEVDLIIEKLPKEDMEKVSELGKEFYQNFIKQF